MTDWSKYPFVRMLIPLVLGIWFASFFPLFKLSFATMAATMLALFGVAVASSALVKTMRLNWFFGSVMACYLFIGGYALTCTSQAMASKDCYCHFKKDAKAYVVRVYDYPIERENNIRVPLQMEYQFGDSLSSKVVSGKVMANFQKTDSAFFLRYGDLIAINAPVGEVAGPKNPNEFDYRSYLMRRGITGQVFLGGDDWVGLQTNKANPIYAFAFRFRDILLASLQNCGLNNDEFGVAAAILLGYDDSLADEVRQRYIAAGAMHILCVSGLHVGIIYLLASALLSFLNRKKWQTTLKQIILLALIWFYALIAGLSPSILRASLMISFVIIGDMIGRKGFVVNTIAASAFVLLCVNPNNLFEIGFQLSYAAVIGIVLLQHPIYNLFYVKNRLIDKAWEITAVALSAQIATIPFTLLYFNQFTTYFWLSNLFMTPISFVVVISGMVLLLVSWIPYLNILVGYLVWGTVYLMNAFVSWVEQLPFSIIKGLYINDFEFLMLFLSFLLLLVAIAAGRRRILIGMLTVMLFFMFSLTYRVYMTDKQKGMTIYSLRKHTAVDFVVATHHVLLADSALMADESALEYSLKGAWTQRHLSHRPQIVDLKADYEDVNIRKRKNLISFDGKLLALWDEWNASDSLSYRIPVDYMLVMGKQVPDVRSILNGYEIKMLLVDGSVPNYLAVKWVNQAEEMGLPYVNIGEGALDIME